MRSIAYVATSTSTSNVPWVKDLGADLVVDYKEQDFTSVGSDYDVVLCSLSSAQLEKSIQIMKPGGHLISISGPPTPEFAADQGRNWLFQKALWLASRRIWKKASLQQVPYDFVFMRADGAQLGEIASLIESGSIRPVIERVFPFESIPEALTYVEQGRVKGKVVIEIRGPNA